jgi:hypothetical protein
VPGAPLDTVESVLINARVRLNDAIASINGDILTDAQPFTPTVVNNAWRRLQEYLANRGFSTLDREIILSNIPACVPGDQGIRVYLNWAGYFDGLNNHGAIVFPPDMICPRRLGERISGSAANFTPIDQVFDGLPTAPRTNLNRLWEWRQESIYMPGAQGSTDILLQYAGFFADFTYGGGPPAVWAPLTVPMMRCQSAFSWFICGEAARPRGDLDAGYFDEQGQIAAEYIWNRDYREPRSLYKGAELGKMTDVRTPTLGPTEPRGPRELQPGPYDKNL